MGLNGTKDQEKEGTTWINALQRGKPPASLACRRLPRRLPAVLDREVLQVCVIDASSVAAVKGRILKRQPTVMAIYQL